MSARGDERRAAGWDASEAGSDADGVPPVDARSDGLRRTGPDPEAEAHLWRASHDVREADSAGVPWRGRTLSAQPFADDDGTAPDAFADAIRDFRAGEGAGPAAVLDALRDARLLIPLLAERAEEGVTASGRIVDKQAELSIVTVEGPDGRRTLPVFSSVEALARWRPDARPVPVEARRAAVAAIDDDTQLIVVDPGSPTEFGLRRPAVWALAKGEPWRLPWQDERVLEAIAAPLASRDDVREVEVRPGAPAGSLDGAELHVIVPIEPPAGSAAGAAELERARLAAELRSAWASDPALLERVDSLAVSVVPAAPRGEVRDGPRAGGRPGQRRGMSRWLRGRGRA